MLREFAKAIAACMPGLGKEELYWRLDFLAGALTYAMADFGLIKRPSGVSEAAHRERAARELIRFAAAGFKQPDALHDLGTARMRFNCFTTRT